MLITFEELEVYDEIKEEFFTYPKEEHDFHFNLVILDKWESKYRKRLLDNDQITSEEFIDLFSMMCNYSVPEFRYGFDQIEQLKKFMTDIPSATVLPKQSHKAGERKTILTSEIIYAYMCILGIPMEWETRNLNKLIVLINTISNLQSPPKKMSKAESMEEHRRIIMERRKNMERNS